MNRIAIARETICITKEKQYMVGEQTVFLPEHNYAQFSHGTRYDIDFRE